ncbi:MAG: hypothetical protein JWL96_771 [Sphingomonas bacterium]|uniref:hypothetical protein n=1 Tax=Sphingomonas bacterium TaxID=1895847 RepID=UPI0026019EF9|nr:hypothetical protein [Sphingomonas bacterium]MDB5708701.1 hypothetical protein [Sphingomonas bacterium]
MRLPDFLRNISGEPEIGRMSLALGVFFSVTTPIAFEIYEIGWNGGHFDITPWCLAYPGGLATLVTAGVVAIGNKEKQVAAARQTIAAVPLDDKTGAST